MTIPTLKSMLHVLIALGLLLRVVIPVGLMPATDADGWHLKVCPTGMPVAVMVAVFGDEHAHHHHHSDEPAFEHCDFSTGLSSALIADVSLVLAPTDILISSVAFQQFQPPRTNTSTNYFPRAPPTAVLT